MPVFIRWPMKFHLASIVTLLALSACKPPPTDASLDGDMPQADPTYASAPLPSPETGQAVWALLPDNQQRIVYGLPGKAALVALECVPAPDALMGEQPSVADLYIQRLSPADEGAGAMLAMVGNGHIGRIAVDAQMDGKPGWTGHARAYETVWEPLAGPRQVTLTVPGAGMVVLHPSTLPGRLIEACRTGAMIADIPAPATMLDTAKSER